MSDQLLQTLKAYHERGWTFNFNYDGIWHVAAYHESFKKSNYIELPQADGETPEEAFRKIL